MTASAPTLVIDASALLDYVLGHRQGPRVGRVLAGQSRLHAPELIDAEVLLALRRWELAGSIEYSRLQRAREFAGLVRVQRHPLQIHNDRVWALRQWITVSDAYYVSLAAALRAPLLTTDGKLARTAATLSDVTVINLDE